MNEFITATCDNLLSKEEREKREEKYFRKPEQMKKF